MLKLDAKSRSLRQRLGTAPSVLALMVSICTSITYAQAVVPPGNGDTKLLSGLSPEVNKLLQDADNALKSGDRNLALIQLKNAVRLAPQNGEVRGHLGVELLRAGDAVDAERELRQARNDKASDEVVVPAILQAMLMRNETKELLKEFADPAEVTQERTAADVLRARAVALQALGQPAVAKAAMDRALRLRRDATMLVSGAKLAGQQGDLVLSARLSEEARKLAPTNEDALVIATLLMRRDGHSENALRSLDEFVTRVPQSIAAKIMRIDILLELKQDAKAKEAVDALLKQLPTLAYGHYYRGVLLAHANNIKGAWQELQTLQPEFVQSEPRIAMTVSSIAVANGNMESGGAILATLVSKHPEIAAARLQLAALRLMQRAPGSALDVLAPLKGSSEPLVQAVFAQVYLQLRRFDDAIAALEIAAASPNANDLLKRQLALSELQAGDTDRAIEGFQKILDRDPENPALAAPLITALQRAGKSDEAMQVIDRLGKASKKGPLPEFLRGQVLISRGDLAGASRAFGEALRIDPRFAPALYYRANLQVGRGNPDDANRDLQQLLALDPSNMPAYVRLAQIASDREREAEAIAWLEKAMKVAPNNPGPRLALANLQMAHGKYQDAQSTVTALLQVAPNSVEGIVLKGRIEFLRGAKAESVNTYRRLAAANPQSAVAYILLSEVLSGNKDQLAAEEAAKKAIELDPNSDQARSALIEIQLSTGKEENAVATARAYAAANPGPAADLLHANTLVRAKRNNEAIALLEKSLASKSDSQVASRLSQIVMSSGNSKRAVAILANWLSKNPNDFALRQEYGSLLLETGDETGSRREFETILKQSPENSVALNNLGWILQKDDPGRALTLVSLAAKISPHSPEIADTLGWLKLQRRDSQGALTLLQRAHDLEPDSASIAYHFALALDATGKRAEAKTLLQMTLAKSPKFPGAVDAKEVLARW